MTRSRRRRVERARPATFATVVTAAVLVGLGSGATAGCARATQLMLVVDTDLAPSDFDALTFHVEGSSRPPQDATADLAAFRAGRPITFALVGERDPAEVVTVTARARRGADTVVEQAVRARFVRGRDRVVVIALCSRCRAGGAAACPTEPIDMTDRDQEWDGATPAGACGAVDPMDGGGPDAAPDAAADGPAPDAPPPPRSSEIVQVSAGGSHTCALEASGQVLCWGNNSDGQLGRMTGGAMRDTNTTVPVAGLLDAAGVTAGETHTCAWTRGGAVYCWGINSSGQLGIGSLTPARSYAALPVAGLPAGDPASRVVAGHDHTCALLRSGAVYCWGNNALGQLGVPGDGHAAAPRAGLAATELAAGRGFTCARRTDDVVSCWGDTTGSRQAGSGLAVAPGARVPGSLALWGGHGCALTAGGARCWGSNTLGESGSTDVPSEVSSPRAVGWSEPVVGVMCGYYFSCVVGATSVGCFGSNNYGQLGTGATSDGGVPVAMERVVLPAGARLVEVDAGGSHSCGRLSTGAVVCWGINDEWQLGAGAMGAAGSATPVVVPGLRAYPYP